jgi:Flp pilus assembly protein protease CpaA
VYALFAQAQQPDLSALTSGPVAIVSNIVGLVGLVCFILVIVKMFQNNQTGLAIACIVGLCVCGIGYFVAFIMGWVKSGEWKLKPVMLVWTIVLVVNLILSGYVYATMPTPVTP